MTESDEWSPDLQEYLDAVHADPGVPGRAAAAQLLRHLDEAVIAAEGGVAWVAELCGLVLALQARPDLEPALVAKTLDEVRPWLQDHLYLLSDD